MLKTIFQFECRFPLKGLYNIDILDSITMACNIYVTLICNIIIFKGIYKTDVISRPDGFSRHTGNKIIKIMQVFVNLEREFAI